MSDLSKALDTLEHARRYCVDTMHCYDITEARAYLLAMEIFDRAWWAITVEAQKEGEE